jgi:sortase B
VDKNNRELAVYATVHDTEQRSEGTEEHRGPDVDWAGLKKINDDVVGWLQVPGTTINYPVYQGETNDTYLHTSATGEYLFGGQIFIDCDNTAPGMVDPVTLVYGHHLVDGSMFEQIGVMDNQERFDEIDTVWYVTEQATWECEPLFLFYVHETDQSVRTFRWDDKSVAERAALAAHEAKGGDADAEVEIPVDIEAAAKDGKTPEQRFTEYLQQRFAQAVTMRSDAAQILPGVKHALCLITCNYLNEYEGHGRTILVCVPKDEATAALKASAQ